MKDEEINLRLVTLAGIQRLLTFLPVFEDSDVSFGEAPSVENVDEKTIRIISSTLSSEALDFVAACYAENFIQSFDWVEWNRQNKSELNSEGFIRNADLLTIVKMLTAHFRADRFCDGHLLCVMQNGTILKILRRLGEINSETENRASTDKPRRPG